MLIALLSTLIVLCAVLLISFLWERRKCLRMQQRLFRESRKLERTSHIAGAILKNVHAFILLIDNDFKVLKTNYYQKTGTKKGTEEKRVGDLLMQLVNDILDMSKIEAGTLEFVQATVDVNLLLSDLQQLFQMRVDDVGGKIQIIAEPSRSSCMIQTDRNRVAQVLSNFAGNAIKFIHEGSIRLGYEARDTELYFYVKDTGAGIPAEKLPDVFERFVKLNKDKKGAGLGLSISQTIVAKLGGQIGADSVEGKGSTFWFTIPYRSCGKPR